MSGKAERLENGVVVATAEGELTEEALATAITHAALMYNVASMHGTLIVAENLATRAHRVAEGGLRLVGEVRTQPAFLDDAWLVAWPASSRRRVA